LVRREEINMKQKQLFRMLAADAQKRLDKTSADTKNLSEELKSLKGNLFNKARRNLNLRKSSKQRLSNLMRLKISFCLFCFCSREFRADNAEQCASKSGERVEATTE